MIKTIIFDYDGTIHNTLRIYEPAFRKAYKWLVDKNLVEERTIDSSEIASWLGLNSKEMWDMFLPELAQTYKDEASAMIGAMMVKQIERHEALWYEGARDVLTKLKQAGYKLLILSNCKITYRKAHWKEFEMQRWFESFYDCESYGFRPKTEIVKQIANEFEGPYLVVGDRYHDFECAKSCGGRFAACLYGYGQMAEFEGADYLVNDIRDILEVVK